MVILIPGSTIAVVSNANAPITGALLAVEECKLIERAYPGDVG